MAATKLSTLALLVAVVAGLLIFFVELGTSLDALAESFLGLGDGLREMIRGFAGAKDSSSDDAAPSFEALEGLLASDSEDLPGLAIASLLALDFLLMTTVVLFALPLLVAPRLLAMMQGCLGMILGVVAILLALVTLVQALVGIVLMFGLLLAIPFGTIAYMVLYADFEIGRAAAILSLLMTLKIVLAVAIVVAHERFLVNLGFVALVGTSFLAMILISLLHNFPPTFLVSITDSVAALIVCILAILWGIVYLVGGFVGFLSMLKGLVT